MSHDCLNSVIQLIQISSKDPDEPQAPEIIQPLKNASAVENKNATFACRITGCPKPKVTWLKGARELFNSAKHEIMVTGNLHELTIRGVFGEDEDTYTCRAVNEAGTKSTKAELRIQMPPKLNVPPRFREAAFLDKVCCFLSLWTSSMS